MRFARACALLVRRASAGRTVSLDARERAALPPLQLGTVFEERRAFSAADVDAFAALTGDTNPIHTQLVRRRRAAVQWSQGSSH
jgi:acyl dehydratase